MKKVFFVCVLFCGFAFGQKKIYKLDFNTVVHGYLNDLGVYGIFNKKEEEKGTYQFILDYDNDEVRISNGNYIRKYKFISGTEYLGVAYIHAELIEKGQKFYFNYILDVQKNTLTELAFDHDITVYSNQ